MEPKAYDAIIIGAGHNGLVAASYLARAGLEVLVLDRRNIVGGAATSEEIFPGYTMSTCAAVVHALQPQVVRDLRLIENGYRVKPLDPAHLWPLPDGRHAIFWRDYSRTRLELEKFSPADARAYVDRWIPFWSRAGAILHPYFLTVPPTIRELERSLEGEDRKLFDRLVHSPLLELLEETFETDEVRAAVMHSYDVEDIERPGALLSYASIWAAHPVDPTHQGVPVGGMSGLSDAMARAATGYGAGIRLGAEVERIVIEDGRAVGVSLVDGQEFRSRLVVSGADPKRTFLDLIDSEAIDPAVSEAVAALDTECGTLKFHAALDELPDFSRYLGDGYDPRLTAAFRICPSVDYYRRTCEDVRSGEIARYPLVTAFLPTVHDPSVAPPGKHAISMWVRYVPVRPAVGSWDDLRRAQGELLIDIVTEYAPNFRRSIIDWELYTPLDIERRVYLTDGNYHHTNHVTEQLLGDRLFTGGGYRSPVRALYMCGAGTHPGGEVTGAPGHNAAAVILGDLKRSGDLRGGASC
jgi:phytoene dehydrogenase-like protein